MRQLFEQVRADEMTMRFCAACPICGKRQYAGRLPLRCRDKDMIEQFEQGKFGGLKQKAYNKRKAAAVQHLARFFNLCRNCGKWICDGCYDSGDDRGICRDCKTHKSK